jgi:hypothetical protein
MPQLIGLDHLQIPSMNFNLPAPAITANDIDMLYPQDRNSKIPDVNRYDKVLFSK